MDPENNPFKDFDPEKSDKILTFAESICENEVDAAAHFAACLMGIAPSLEIAVSMLEFVQSQVEIVESGPLFLISNELHKSHGDNKAFFKGEYFLFVNEIIGVGSIKNPTTTKICELLQEHAMYIDESTDLNPPWLITEVKKGTAEVKLDGTKTMTPIKIKLIEALQNG